MKPIIFKECNDYLLYEDVAGEKEKSLPVYRDSRHTISRWEMSWLERLSALFTGKIWLLVKTNGAPHHPIHIRGAGTPFARIVGCRRKRWFLF